MLNPKDSYDLNQLSSPYANCIATAKLARAISEENEKEHIITTEKPLKTAIEEFVKGKYKVDAIKVEEE